MPWVGCARFARGAISRSRNACTALHGLESHLSQGARGEHIAGEHVLGFSFRVGQHCGSPGAWVVSARRTSVAVDGDIIYLHAVAEEGRGVVDQRAVRSSRVAR